MNQHHSLKPGAYYHIYNRGINGENIFKEERNYAYFLSKYAIYLSPILETYAYCLLKNHFHLLVRVKDNLDLKGLKNLTGLETPNKNLSGLGQEKGLHHADNLVSKKFSDLFNSYTKSINKAYNRTGSLFETPFRRIEVTSDAYFTRLIWYIHFNPQKHGFVNDFREYPYSSYHSFLANKNTKLEKAQVLKWFGSENQFLKFHHTKPVENEFTSFIIEF